MSAVALFVRAGDDVGKQRIRAQTRLFAQSGGSLSWLRNLFGELPPESFAEALTKSGVSPAALATGYVVFFVYAGLLGVFAIALAVIVAARERRRAGEMRAEASGTTR